jgi:hypothetical protein
MQSELSRICKSCPEQVIHNIVRSGERLMKKYLQHYAPEAEEIQFFENREK